MADTGTVSSTDSSREAAIMGAFGDLERQAQDLIAALDAQAARVTAQVDDIWYRANSAGKLGLAGWARATIGRVAAATAQYRNGRADIAWVLEELRDVTAAAGAMALLVADDPEEA